jgi:drug/metabolite transporter (DMT)-like permease
MGVTIALASMVCFAINILVNRHAVEHMPVESGFLVVLGTNLALLTLGHGIERLAGVVPVAFAWSGFGWFVLAGIVGTYLSRRLLFDAVKAIGPARTSIFHSSAPVFALVAAWLLIGESLGGYELALMALVLAGLWISQSGKKGPGDARPLAGDALRKGLLLGLFVVIGFGFGNALRGIALRSWTEPLLGALVSTAAATALQLAATRNWPRVILALRNGSAKAYTLYVASGIATAGGTVLVGVAALHMEIALAALVIHTTPLVIFPASYFLYRNRDVLSLRVLVGTACVLAGITALALR